VGARVAVLLAADGWDVVVACRARERLARAVAEQVRGKGRRALTVCADLTDPAAVQRMAAETAAAFGTVEALVLNASGGLETGMAADYPHRLNAEGQLLTLDTVVPLMPPGGRVVFETSHQAHFHGQRPTLPEYLPVAQSKRAGEDALRARIPGLTALGLDLVVVSGDVIERTVTAMLMERAQPELFARRRAEGGPLLSIEEFARSVTDAATLRYPPTGATVYVGPTA
jgi:NAD(P)-dependent dehydrogenase (short-subunit alcohol dehydrogenase family)